MINIVILVAFVLVRYIYPEIYKVFFWLACAFIWLVPLFLLSNNTMAAEEMGSEVLLFFSILLLEACLSRFFDKYFIRNYK